MMPYLYRLLEHTPPSVRRIVVQRWYQHSSGNYRDKDWTFMNWGFVDLDSKASRLELDPSLEAERYSIQLYHHVASAVDIKGKDVLEVGSGRGGGAAYIQRYLQSRTMTGVDFSANLVDFSQATHTAEGLIFIAGDAESLPFDDHSFDVVINVESSHTYGSMETFLGEVTRVLRPNGYFLFADVRPKESVHTLRCQLQDSGLHILDEKDISQNVLKALETDTGRKYTLIKAKVRQVIAKSIKNFAGMRGLSSGETQYLSVVMQKGAA